MTKITRWTVVAGASLLLMTAPRLAADVMPIQGDWVLDEKASKNFPESVRFIDLKIWLKGKDLYTQRILEGNPVGEPLMVPVDGSPVTRELAKGQTGTIQAVWKSSGKVLEQVVKTKASNLLSMEQTTLVTISADGKIMTRIRTTKTGGDVTKEEVLVYRRKN